MNILAWDLPGNYPQAWTAAGDSVTGMPNTLDQSVDVAAPAGRVWDLVSTSEGLSSWFVDATIVPGLQGSVTLRFAPGAEATVPILVWDPPHRISDRL